jgi:hypothetical protein
MMNNLKSDAGRFRSAFNNSVKSSTIRHTSRAKDSRNLVQGFENQAKGMLDRFRYGLASLTAGKLASFDLPGERRIIQSLDLWYGKENWRRRPKVSLYGLN